MKRASKYSRVGCYVFCHNARSLRSLTFEDYIRFHNCLLNVVSDCSGRVLNQRGLLDKIAHHMLGGFGFSRPRLARNDDGLVAGVGRGPQGGEGILPNTIHVWS